MGTTRRGFTLIDLIVALTLAICLIPTAVSVVGRTRESADRVKCASNLKQIGQAILLYANENGGSYPRTRYDPKSGNVPTAWSGTDSTTPFATNGPAVNDVTAAYRLLLATQDLVPEVFLCPMSEVSNLGFARARYQTRHANFVDERELNYSFANPYPTAAVRDSGYDLNANTLSAELAVASDINPGVSPPDSDVIAITATASAHYTRRGNSPNHDRDGQNVLYGDGHVEFQQSPFVGLDHDNIFTFGRRDKPEVGFGVVGPPMHPGDSVLLPAVDAERWRTLRAEARTSMIVWTAVPTLLILALIVAVARGRRKHSPESRLPLPSA